MRFYQVQIAILSSVFSNMWCSSVSKGTECCDQVVSTPASYLEDPRFNSWLRDWLSWLSFLWFYLVPPGECWDSTLKFVHDRFLPNPFQFIIYLSPLIWRCTVSVTEEHHWINYYKMSKDCSWKPKLTFSRTVVSRGYLDLWTLLYLYIWFYVKKQSWEWKSVTLMHFKSRITKCVRDYLRCYNFGMERIQCQMDMCKATNGVHMEVHKLFM
jgi:hypothetical protein